MSPVHTGRARSAAHRTGLRIEKDTAVGSRPALTAARGKLAKVRSVCQLCRELSCLQGGGKQVGRFACRQAGHRPYLLERLREDVPRVVDRLGRHHGRRLVALRRRHHPKQRHRQNLVQTHPAFPQIFSSIFPRLIRYSMRPWLLLFLCILAATARRASTLEPRDMSSKSPYHNQTSQQRKQSPRTAPEPRSFTDGPKCNPVSLTMLTRHGSRSADSEAKFTMPIDYLEQAERAAALTPAGAVALQNSRALASRLVNITWGGLSPLGQDELHALGNDPRPLKRTTCRTVATKASTQRSTLVQEEHVSHGSTVGPVWLVLTLCRAAHVGAVLCAALLAVAARHRRGDRSLTHAAGQPENPRALNCCDSLACAAQNFTSLHRCARQAVRHLSPTAAVVLLSHCRLGSTSLLSRCALHP